MKKIKLRNKISLDKYCVKLNSPVDIVSGSLHEVNEFSIVEEMIVLKTYNRDVNLGPR